jgi:hypothetical protein
VSLGVMLSGCAAPSPSGRTESPAAVPSTTPESPPAFDPNAPADEAMALFDSVNESTLAADPEVLGRGFIDGLAGAGFDKTTMELTPDATTIGNDADSIQFSVRWGDSCLIGQNGPAVDGYHSLLAPVLGTGTCLIGSTRPIDW